MNKIPGKMKLLNKLISLSAAGLLVGTAGVYAANDGQSATNQNQQKSQTNQQQKQDAPQFSDVDRDQDQRLVWTEIYAVHEDEIDRAGWEEQSVMDQYDRNRDAGLDADEYVIFITTLAAEPGSNVSQTQSQQNQELGQNQSDQNQSDQNQSNQSPSDEQAMTGSEQEVPTNRQADPGSAEYYDEEDTDVVAESYEQNMQDAQPADIASDQQGEDQELKGQELEGQDEVAGTQSPQSDRQESQAQPSGATSDQSQSSVTTATVIAITDIPDISAEDLEDRKVVNLGGDEIGEVEDVVLGADGVISGLVVEVGGFWDIGDKDVFASANELRISGDEIVWETTLDEDALKELPEYEAPEISAIQ